MIRVENVHKWYGGQKVLDGISFDITTGSVTTIIGGSGAGKSVLIRLMIGLEQPDKGAIVIDGENIVGMRHSKLNKIRRRFGVLFQDGALFDSLSVRENVAFPIREHLRLREKEIDRIVQEKLAKVGMSGHEGKFPAQLSGGMRKRVGLARALALEPDHRLLRRTHQWTGPDHPRDDLQADCLNTHGSHQYVCARKPRHSRSHEDL